MNEVETGQVLIEIKRMIADSALEGRIAQKDLCERLTEVVVNVASANANLISIQRQIDVHEDHDASRFSLIWKVIIGSGMLSAGIVLLIRMTRG